MMLRKLALFIFPALFLVACGSSAPLVPSWTQLGKDIDGEALGDNSGRSVSLSSDGKTVAIGAARNDGNGDSAGHVRIYQLTNYTWTQIGNDINGEAARDLFGSSVSLSSDGKTVAVGAVGNDGDGLGFLVGRVYVYKWTDDTSWEKVGMSIDGEASGAYSGISVSLSSDGRTVAIGAPGVLPGAAGYVRVYQWTDGTSWVKIGMNIDGEAAGNAFGFSVSLSSDGRTVAIGAPGTQGRNDIGFVSVYQWTDGTSWVKVGGVNINGRASGNAFGISVSLSSDGKTVAVGAYFGDAGYASIYKLTNNAWIKRGKDIDGENFDDQFGSSVSLSSDGSTVAVGATGSDGKDGNPSYYDSGRVCVYKWTDESTSWVKVGMGIDGGEAGDNSGRSVSLSSDGNTVGIGAPAPGRGFFGPIGKGSSNTRVFKVTFKVTKLGDQRCKSDSVFEEYWNDEWIERDVSPGTKCCPHVDGVERITLQLAAFDCPTPINE